jgi:hypothetical protein
LVIVKEINIIFLVFISVLGSYLILCIVAFIALIIDGHHTFIETIGYLQGYQDALDGLDRRRGTGYEKIQHLLPRKGRLEKLLKDREKTS